MFTSPPRRSITPRSQDILNGLVSRWLFDEAAGALVADGVGTNDGTASGMARAAGKIGPYCGSFDGVDDYVNFIEPAFWNTNLGNTAALGTPSGDYVQNMTISFWMKDVATNTNETVLQNSKVSGHPGSNGGIWFRTLGDGTYRLWVFDTAADAWVFQNSIGTRTTDWTLITLTFNTTDIIVYQDGVQISTGTLQDAVDMDTASEFNIGRSKDAINAATEYFEGLVDDLRIYDRTLSPEEIAKIHSLYAA